MEAVWKIEVDDFPAFIVVDDKGNDFFDLVRREAAATRVQRRLNVTGSARHYPSRSRTIRPRRPAAGTTMGPVEALLEREHLLDEIAGLQRSVGTRGGCLVWLGGEAGVGKSTLVNAAAATSAGRILIGHCDALSTPRPLGPLLDMASNGADRVGPSAGERRDPSRALRRDARRARVPRPRRHRGRALGRRRHRRPAPVSRPTDHADPVGVDRHVPQ